MLPAAPPAKKVVPVKVDWTKAVADTGTGWRLRGFDSVGREPDRPLSPEMVHSSNSTVLPNRFLIPMSDFLGLAVPVAATALGATMIEKHITLKRSDGGPDALFSSEPHEFKAMAEACRQAEAAVRPRATAPKGENRELRQANEILRKASAYFAMAELDRRSRT